MSVPRMISLVRDKAVLAIKQEPGTARLRTEHTIIRQTQSGELKSTQEAPFELDLQFGQPSQQKFGIRLYTDDQHWTEIGFDRSKGEFYMDRTKSGRAITADFPTRTTAT